MKLLERYEVIDDLTELKTDNPLHDAFMKGYMHCYNKWEEYNGVLTFVLLDNSSFVPEYLDMLRGKLPESVHATVMKKMTDIIIKSPRKANKVLQQLEFVQGFLDDAFSNPAGNSFIPKFPNDVKTQLTKLD